MVRVVVATWCCCVLGWFVPSCVLYWVLRCGNVVMCECRRLYLFGAVIVLFFGGGLTPALAPTFDGLVGDRLSLPDGRAASTELRQAQFAASSLALQALESRRWSNSAIYYGRPAPFLGPTCSKRGVGALGLQSVPQTARLESPGGPPSASGRQGGKNGWDFEGRRGRRGIVEEEVEVRCRRRVRHGRGCCHCRMVA